MSKRFPPSRGSLGGNMWNKPFSGARSRKPRRRLGPSDSQVFQIITRKRMHRMKGK